MEFSLIALKIAIPKRGAQVCTIQNCISIKRTHQIHADVTFCVTKSSGEYVLPNTSDYEEDSLQITTGRHNSYEINCKYSVYLIFVLSIIFNKRGT